MTIARFARKSYFSETPGTKVLRDTHFYFEQNLKYSFATNKEKSWNAKPRTNIRKSYWTFFTSINTAIWTADRSWPISRNLPSADSRRPLFLRASRRITHGRRR